MTKLLGSARTLPVDRRGAHADLTPKDVRIRYEMTKLFGSRLMLTFGPYPSQTAAEAANTRSQALELGWRPPRPWEFWRWRDCPRR
jgi:hypothetical protein